MKILINCSLALTFLILFSSSSFAQDDHGSAVVFSWDRFNLFDYPVIDIMGEGTLGIVNYGGIGYEKKLNNNWSIEGGLTIGSRSRDHELSPTSKDEQSSLVWGLNAGPNWYCRGWDPVGVRPYLGARFKYGSYSFERTETSGTVQDKTEFDASTFGIGLEGGADFEPWDGVRIGARYGFSFVSMPESTIKTTSSGNTVESKGPSTTSIGTDFVGVYLKFLW